MFQIEKDKYYLEKEAEKTRELVRTNHPEDIHKLEGKVKAFKGCLKVESCRVRKCKGAHHEQALQRRKGHIEQFRADLKAMQRCYYVNVKIHKPEALLNTMRILHLNIDMESGLVWW